MSDLSKKVNNAIKVIEMASMAALERERERERINQRVTSADTCLLYGKRQRRRAPYRQNERGGVLFCLSRYRVRPQRESGTRKGEQCNHCKARHTILQTYGEERVPDKTCSMVLPTAKRKV